ncbi:MFS transporter [Neobacillus dielmonensis]|uniref:MFS transporter n=1 Tax=Neobacillus dielmonensis TaxID=1347369 RepID=UPI0009DE0859|nr:MFS transporter [Neobacillus dielmonensis]
MVYLLYSFLITGLKKESDNRRIIMLSSYMIAGVFIGLLGIFQSFSILSICIFCVGFCSIVFSINNTTLYQKYVPSHLRGRVFAVRILLSQIGIPIGALFGGHFADYFGIAFLFSVMGVVIILVAIIAFFLPVFHQLDKNTLSSIPQKQTFTQ